MAKTKQPVERKQPLRRKQSVHAPLEGVNPLEAEAKNGWAYLTYGVPCIVNLQHLAYADLATRGTTDWSIVGYFNIPGGLNVSYPVPLGRFASSGLAMSALRKIYEAATT